MYVALSTMEEQYFGDRLSLFVALGPVSMIPNTDIKLIDFALNFYWLLEDTVNLLGIHEIFSRNWFTSEVATAFCSVLSEVCLFV